MGVDFEALLCGRPLKTLRSKVAYDIGTTATICALPILMFMLMSIQRTDSFLDAYALLDCTTADSKAEALQCILRNCLWQVGSPVLKTLLYPCEASYRFLQKGDLLGVGRGTILTVFWENRVQWGPKQGRYVNYHLFIWEYIFQVHASPDARRDGVVAKKTLRKLQLVSVQGSQRLPALLLTCAHCCLGRLADVNSKIIV